MRARAVSSILLTLALGCGGEGGDDLDNGLGTATVQSDPVNGVDASAAIFPFFGGAVSNNVDLDNDGATDDSTAVFLLFLSDRGTLCDEINEGLLSGEQALAETPVGTNVAIIATKRLLDSPSDLTAGEAFVGDGGDVDVQVSFSLTDAQAIFAQAEGNNLGVLNLTAFAETTFDGDFTGALVLDRSGQAAFDVDTDGDLLPDATAIDAQISGSFQGATLCGGLEGLALLISLFAGLGG
jgi:hypothetical protein